MRMASRGLDDARFVRVVDEDGGMAGTGGGLCGVVLVDFDQPVCLFTPDFWLPDWSDSHLCHSYNDLKPEQ
jgi:hypothetical protein